MGVSESGRICQDGLGVVRQCHVIAAASARRPYQSRRRPAMSVHYEAPNFGIIHGMDTKRTDLKIPYGISDFKRLRQEKYYYVDKSEYIRKLELAGNFLFFVRPRRFGKSLFAAIA